MNKMVCLLRIYMYILIFNTGLQLHLVHSSLQCLEARKKCTEDNSCYLTLISISSVCGSLLDSRCNSRDITKCKIVLETLQQSQYFQPTCLCTDYNATCQEFRQGLFNHPCLMIRNEVEAPDTKPRVPTCSGAYRACKMKALCARVYMEFKKACKVARGNRCAMADKNYCQNAWELVQLTPMYGCICTEQHNKRCYRVRSIIMANPCIELAKTLEIAGMITAPRPSGSGGTCLEAFRLCDIDTICHLKLKVFLESCSRNQSHCHRTECLKGMREFYTDVEAIYTHSLTFCSCTNGDEKCFIEKKVLDPICARTQEQQPDCHVLAEKCMKDENCSNILSSYQEKCRMGSDYASCAGPMSECRNAVIAMKGHSLLHTHCICSGYTQACSTWQRELLRNPCVEQSVIDYHVSTTTTTELITTTLFPENATTTVPPPEFCEVEKGDLLIQVGSSIRMYGKNCSSFCNCENDGKILCYALPCLPRNPCQGTFAKYAHGAPTYRAFRGHCICFIGDFVCAKPLPKLYTIGQGVFLFVGYSEREERIIESYTELDIKHSYIRFQKLLDPYNETQCKLLLHANMAGNIIFQVKLESVDIERENGSEPQYLTGVKVKDECLESLSRIDQLINSQSPEIKQDLILSVIKLSTVVITIPPSVSGALSMLHFFNIGFLLLPLLQQILLLISGR